MRPALRTRETIPLLTKIEYPQFRQTQSRETSGISPSNSSHWASSVRNLADALEGLRTLNVHLSSIELSKSVAT